MQKFEELARGHSADPRVWCNLHQLALWPRLHFCFTSPVFCTCLVRRIRLCFFISTCWLEQNYQLATLMEERDHSSSVGERGRFLFLAQACSVYQDGELDVPSHRELPLAVQLEHSDRILLRETSAHVLNTNR